VRHECEHWDHSHIENGAMKPISAFPLIAMLVIVVILIALFGGYL
jgi:hypothetical protein